jgi:succinoglycan biosynthesis protein ExoA
MLVGTSAALVAGFVWWPAWLVPAAHGPGILCGGLAITTGESWRTRAFAPLVLGVMHWAWGIGFMTSPRKLAH